jgi:hypothetical protein
MVFSNNLLMGAAGQGGGYEIDQSIRFSDNDSARLARTVSSSGSLTTWTLSGWIKRGKYTVNINGQWFPVFSASAGSTTYDAPLNFNDVSTGGAFNVTIGGYNWRTSALARDTSAWYHVVIVWDSTNGTSSDRMRLYINGERVTDFSSSASPSSGANSRWNSSSYSHHRIGNLNYNGGETTYIFDGYLSEINFIDGTALDPTSFGEYNDDGVWIPIEYTGSYGTNGFYITGATASDLGEDFSGNGNDFTSSGLATTDQMLDTPTLNFPTFNPLNVDAYTLSDGNLNTGAAGDAGAVSTFAIDVTDSDGFYFEVSSSTAATYPDIGLQDADALALAGATTISDYNTGRYTYQGNTGNFNDQGSTSSYGTTYTTNTIGVLVQSGNLYFSKDGIIQNSGTAAKTGLTGMMYARVSYSAGSGTHANFTVNFGQSAFAHDPGGTYKAWNTANLATPSITDGSAYFNPVLFTGNSGVAFSVTGVGFQPDFVWGKPRSYADNHRLMDVVRGSTKQLISNATNAEFTQAQGITSFDSDGFTVGTHNGLNTGTNTYVAWNWLADNTTGSSNTDGSITSTASVNTTAGFSILTYTGNATVGATVGHGLGIAPKVVIVKSRSNAENWVVGHDSMGWTKAIYLNSTSAPFTLDIYWNNTAPTSSVVELHDHPVTNGNSYTYVMYAFAEIPGYSSFGSYTGNGSTNGTFVYTGFKPAFVILKRTNATQEWQVYDTQRDSYNVADHKLEPNSSSAESTSAINNNLDFLSNGFKLRQANGGMNASGSTYIYMAFAENPFGGDGVAPATAR